MKILLFGSSGKLGTALAAESLRRGVSVETAASCDWASSFPSIPDSPFDAVVNAAAMTDVDECEIRQRDCFLVNGMAPAILASEAAKRHIPFIHISSDYVFSRKPFNGWLIAEDEDREPCNYYGVAKAFAEEALTHLMLVDRAALSPIWVLRTACLYGNGAGKPDLFRRFAEEAIRDRKLTVTGQLHANLFTPTHAGDLARVILDVLERRPEPGIYNAVGTQTATAMDVAVVTAGALAERGLEGVKIQPVISSGSAVQRPVDVLLGCAKLAAAGITPPAPWMERAPGYVGEVMEVVSAASSPEKI